MLPNGYRRLAVTALARGGDVSNHNGPTNIGNSWTAPAGPVHGQNHFDTAEFWQSGFKKIETRPKLTFGEVRFYVNFLSERYDRDP